MIKKSIAVLAGSLLLVSSTVAVSTAANAASSCSSITKQVVVADGFASATGPKVTAYNYAKASANAANALGTTLDFGAKALIVGCVSPADLVKLSVKAQGKGKPTMTATQYLAWLASKSGGAMKKTKVNGVWDYLDFGNGKEDGLGSLSTAKSIRLDAWVASSKYIILTFSAPATKTASAALNAFIASTNTVLK